MRIWHLACFSVVDHARSSKLLTEVLLVAGYWIFFWDHSRQIMRTDFFLSTAFFLMLLAGVESYLFLARAADRRFHLVLIHVGSRWAAWGGLFLGVALMLGGVTLGLGIAGTIFTSVLRETTWAAYLGSMGLLLINALTTMALCFLFSPLAAGSNLGWAALALVVFGFSRDAFLLGPGAGLWGGLASFLHNLLPPFLETINAAEGRLGSADAVLFGLHQLLYGTLALGLALWCSQQRDWEPLD